jgi:hypothetical protein
VRARPNVLSVETFFALSFSLLLVLIACIACLVHHPFWLVLIAFVLLYTDSWLTWLLLHLPFVPACAFIAF